MIKAIETEYKGYRMRSRLEARWAVFFDALGIDWQYESEGYVMADGSYYLPDFYLPTFCGGTYCEIKPKGGDFAKAKEFCKESGEQVWLCEGTPEYRIYDVLNIEKMDDGTKDMVNTPGIPNFDQAYGEDRMFWIPGYENTDGTIPEEYYEDHYTKAVRKARSARFEFGETGL